MRSRFLLLPLLAAMTGCAFGIYPTRIHRRSSLLEYLSPGRPVERGRTARLQLPLKIGIAFVPSNEQPIESEVQERLLQMVAGTFNGRPWAGAIRIIPSGYLERRGGYDNLEQVASLMDVDVVALASVDQIQHNDPTALSILYLSVIGEYLIPGDRNETHTMIDVGVVDVRSHSFLFRAAGRSRHSGMVAPVDRDRVLRGRSEQGFREAMADLTKQLDKGVDQFKAGVASGARPDVDIITKEGKSVAGGGGFDAATAGLLVGLVGLAFIGGRKEA